MIIQLIMLLGLGLKGDKTFELVTRLIFKRENLVIYCVVVGYESLDHEKGVVHVSPYSTFSLCINITFPLWVCFYCLLLFQGFIFLVLEVQLLEALALPSFFCFHCLLVDELLISGDYSVLNLSNSNRVLLGSL
jgi:hypothetical protein